MIGPAEKARVGTLLTVNHWGARHNGETVTPKYERTRYVGATRRRLDFTIKPSNFVNAFALELVNKVLTAMKPSINVDQQLSPSSRHSQAVPRGFLHRAIVARPSAKTPV